ncbi:hypothetical protein J4409_00020 [Candidatus Woesearchaeota archaeon]|nr:hypothetical protein [Candidatus Woesearchaeota archaeon]
MNEDVEYIIAAIAIISAAGLLFFGFGDVTGYYSKEITSTTVDVSPSIINAGEYIDITVNAAGKRGVDSDFRVCKDNKLCFSSGSLHCTGYGCRGEINVNYRVPSDLIAGKYFVKVRDMNTGEDVRGYFEVE